MKVKSNTINTNDFFTPDCPHSKKCVSKGFKCNSCKHNNKKDYYERDNPFGWWTETNPNIVQLPIGDPYIIHT